VPGSDRKLIDTRNEIVQEAVNLREVECGEELINASCKTRGIVWASCPWPFRFREAIVSVVGILEGGCINRRCVGLGVVHCAIAAAITR
jgi:hypothetical protein